MEPLLSIVTPTLNSAAFIERNLRSVRDQTYGRVEHIVIDGGSTDETLDIVRAIDRDARVFSEPARGISDAFNRGIRRARGEVIGILNSDDYYDAEVLRDVGRRYRNSRFDFILHGDIRMFRGERGSRRRPFPLPDLFFYFDLPFYHPTTFVPARIYRHVGLYDPAYAFAMDYDFLLRARLRGYAFQRLPRIVAHFRLGGTANRDPLGCHREVLRSQLRHGLNPHLCRVSYLSKVAVNRLKALCRRDHPARPATSL